MLPLLRRWASYLTLLVTFLFFTFQALTFLDHHSSAQQTPLQRLTHPGFFGKKFRWRDLPQRHPVHSFTSPPSGPLEQIPRIQHEFGPETESRRTQRLTRQAAVKEAFVHSWEGYKKNAWLQDEVSPVSGGSHNGYGGWGATLVDSLDTLWIMGLKREFLIAVAGIRKIDFTTTPLERLNVFETTIRYLGGLLSAYDLSNHKYQILLEKAIELGDMVYVAFDTPNRMPVTRWDWRNSALGGPQEAARFSLLAEVGSLTLEFTRLSQLTGNNKWYDAIARITDLFEDQQNRTKVPGLFATMIDTKNADFTRDVTFSFGGMADSLYEYLPKQHLMLGGRSEQYRSLYLHAIESAKEHIFFQPLNQENRQLLISGSIKRNSAARITLIPEGEHLSCFAGGMVALAAKAFDQTQDLDVARRLVDGCLWAYESMPSGIMPEIYRAAPCKPTSSDNCSWSQERWYEAITSNGPEEAQSIISSLNLPPGFVEVKDSRYQLRPEAIESMFILYRITGDMTLQDQAWDMFQTISNLTRTRIAHAGLEDVRDVVPKQVDSMESFWTAETLKYFYLIFAEPELVSLDEFVL
ncbi:hypothetical protein LTR62_007850 [Meristemomyces frigidus]|uniref:alpha-1,2-Mannosidase n=1 Tax=Meristemomyces frigidus TaxID=1508187 RepID=A0AAN7TBD1_9PEZI|nr:hypothetical protein LTR62_007850 [Meristemomyces frigidus]